jgi:hypothetical protein
MADFQELLKEKAQQEKKEFWDRLMREHIDKISAKYSGALKRGTKNKILEMAQYEMDGGNCPICSTPWAKVVFDNHFLCGSYFQPACECYVLCPSCHRWLYDEFDIGNICSNCGWEYIVDGKKRYGVEYERELFQLDRIEELKKKYAAWKKPKAQTYSKKIKMEDDE